MPNFNTQTTPTASQGDNIDLDALLAYQELATANYQLALFTYKSVCADFTSTNNALNFTYKEYEKYSKELRQKTKFHNITTKKINATIYSIAAEKYPQGTATEGFNVGEYAELIRTNPNLNTLSEELKFAQKNLKSTAKKIFDADSKITQLIEESNTLKAAISKCQANLEKSKSDLAAADVNLEQAKNALSNCGTTDNAEFIEIIANEGNQEFNIFVIEEEQAPPLYEEALLMGQASVDSVSFDMPSFTAD